MIARARLSLQLQVFLLMLTVTLLAGLAVTLIGRYRTNDAVQEETELRLQSLADAAVLVTLDFMLVGEIDRLEMALERVMQSPGIKRLELQDKNRHMVIALTWQDEPAIAPHGPRRRRLVADLGQSQSLLDQWGDAPEMREVRFEGQPYLWLTRALSPKFSAGQLGIVFSNQAIREREAGEQREMLLITLGLLVAIAVLVYGVLSRTLRPVASLARHMRQSGLEEGSAWRGRLLSREMVDISSAYESMRQRLQQQVQALRLGNEMMSATLDRSPNAMLVVGFDGQVRLANRSARRMFHLPGEQEQGHLGPMLNQLLPGMGEWLAPGSVLLGSGGEAEGRRCEARSLDGGRFVAWVHGATINIEGRPDHLFSVRDITREEDAQRQLQLRTQRLNSVLTLSTEGIVLFSAQRHVVYVNPQMLQYLSGLGAGYLINLSLADFERSLAERSHPSRPYKPLDETAVPQPLLFSLGGATERLLVRSWRTTGGGDDELVMFFQDVTEQEVVARMKSDFLSAAAHELRTPLTSILGFSDLMLQHELPPQEQRELLQTIRDQSGLLVNIINEMLDLSRIESRQGQDFRPRACSVAEACRMAVASVRPPGDTRQVDVSHEDPALTVWTDPEKLHQVLVNLLSNAFKFSPEGGPIRLRSHRALREGGAVAVIEVRDHGIGMTEAELGHLFERFYRADKSGHIPGTGLGLSLVKQIVELSGGHIRVDSQPRQGTRVEIQLPLTAPEPGSGAA